MVPYSIMSLRCLLLSLLLSFFAPAWLTPVCINDCCHFLESFPSRLKELRRDYSRIRDFYVSRNISLTGPVLLCLQSPFACQAINSILDFYLRTVLPTAVADVTNQTRDLKPHVESIQHIFHQLKADVTKCRHHFSCKKQFDIRNLNSAYSQMENKGLFKAMGELDLLFNYIENYLASKRERHM
uniref:Interleukin family protein n=1 Tax=Nothobranchius furzeri TaxID=105023 RepID=A0A8C6PDS2_NOTFU